MSVEPIRSLADRPNVEQQQKLARELLRAYRAQDPDAIVRVRAQLPDRTNVTLADAQFVLAREYGFESWAKLKRHIESLEPAALPPQDQIVSAMERGDAATIRRVLQQYPHARALVNAPLFAFGGTALGHAASHGHEQLLDVLLEFGADPNRRSDWELGPWHILHSAPPEIADRLIAAGAEPDACAAAHLDRLELLRQILDADPARVHERGGDGQFPLHFARSRPVVDLLLERGADLDARDLDHRGTAAEWMLEGRNGAGRYALARYLVDRGATADIFLAAALGLTDRVRDMVRSNPSVLELRTSQGEYGEKPPGSLHIYTWTIGPNMSPFQVASQFEQDATVEALRESASPKQQFLVACVRGDGNQARALLRAHPGLMRTLTTRDQRALPDAAWGTPCDAAAVELMLELGFDPATPGQDGGSALHCAAWQGSAACIEAALRHPAVRQLVNRQDPTHHSTPLGWCWHGACHCRNPNGDYFAVARLLLAAGAEVGPGLEHAPPELRRMIEEWPR
jgi:ankyrin repeat protein